MLVDPDKAYEKPKGSPGRSEDPSQVKRVGFPLKKRLGLDPDPAFYVSLLVGVPSRFDDVANCLG